MRILVACEFSGTVRDAFAARGHDAWSCDLLPSESTTSSQHFQCDVLEVLYSRYYGQWDLMVAHPPCTHLAVSGARWFKQKEIDNPGQQAKALQFVRDLMAAPVAKICIENPVSVISSYIRKPDQCIQPWMFGHGEVKKTRLWLKNLPPLRRTNTVAGREAVVHLLPPGPERWKLRSVTYPGIAKAMAEQWSPNLIQKENADVLS